MSDHQEAAEPTEPLADSADDHTAPPHGAPLEVFLTFLKLGLTSFGGPIAHLGHFHREIIERRRWIEEREYAQLIALCQFLPGPASSQLGYSLGLLRGGWLGGLAAFTAFTLPSAIFLVVFAALLPRISGTVGDAAIHGLKLVALAVVAHGVMTMTRRLCPDGPRVAIAVLAAVLTLLLESAFLPPLVVGIGALIGLVVCRDVQPLERGSLHPRYGPRVGAVLLVIFAILLIGLPVLVQVAAAEDNLLSVTEAFYRAGALVFGGGHVVLPLLEETVVDPGWVSQDEFLAGYGAAQAVPGPMFSISAYLGARLPDGQGGLLGAGVSLIAIFLPGMLLVSGMLPMWQAVATRPVAARAIAGVNAAVVGLLGAALYNPVWITAAKEPKDVAIALVGFALIATWRVSVIVVVAWCVLASIAAAVWL